MTIDVGDELLAGDPPEIPSLKIGGARRIEPAAVDAYLERRREASSGA